MILLGTDKRQCRTMRRGSFPQLVTYGRTLQRWAIYWERMIWGEFHNSTDERYLVAHWNDHYWLNRGFSEYDYSLTPLIQHSQEVQS